MITARGSRDFLVRAAWATAAVCGFLLFLMIYFNQFYFLFIKQQRHRPAAAPPSTPRAAAAAAAAVVVAAATAAIGHRPPIAESTRARARARGHLSTAEYKWLSELFQSMILMAGDQESLPPALRHVMAGRGRFMRASAVSIDTHMVVWRVEARGGDGRQSKRVLACVALTGAGRAAGTRS